MRKFSEQYAKRCGHQGACVLPHCVLNDGKLVNEQQRCLWQCFKLRCQGSALLSLNCRAVCVPCRSGTYFCMDKSVTAVVIKVSGVAPSSSWVALSAAAHLYLVVETWQLLLGSPIGPNAPQTPESVAAAHCRCALLVSSGARGAQGRARRPPVPLPPLRRQGNGGDTGLLELPLRPDAREEGEEAPQSPLLLRLHLLPPR